jgi:hypothetical protein
MTPRQEADCLAYDPFAGDRCEERMLSDKIVTARKAGRCCICFETIKPGERVRRQAAIVDGEMFSCRMCEACCIAAAASWTDDGEAIEERTSIGMAAARAEQQAGRR